MYCIYCSVNLDKSRIRHVWLDLAFELLRKNTFSTPEFNDNTIDFSISNFFLFQLPNTLKTYTVDAIDSASILLVIEGSATGHYAGKNIPLCKGSVLFMAANEKLDLDNLLQNMLMFRAYCDLQRFAVRDRITFFTMSQSIQLALCLKQLVMGLGDVFNSIKVTWVIHY